MLSNWILKGFDEAIVNRWNPLHYGSYVDDIIIVDKVEKNSILYKAAREKQHKGAASLTVDSIVERFMCNCRNRDIDTPCQNGIFIKPDEKTYRIHESILEHIGSLIDVQRSKLKVFYFRNGTSPAEQDLIRKYGFKPMSGNTYQLYSWHDVWFSVYCCFELACIQDRALFSSLSDITIGIEWNKDTLYFDHVSSSLARDLHCYVIESNTSQYGGSGVIQPQSSVTSELIRTKGGDNHSILTTDIDIQALREAQYPDISDRKPFKPLPPIFDRGYIKRVMMVVFGVS